MYDSDFYLACCDFISQRHTSSEGAKQSFLLTFITETEDHISTGSSIIDPGIPDGTIPVKTFLQLGLTQQIALHLVQEISNTIDKSITQHLEAQSAANMLDVPMIDLAEIAKDCGTRDEFRKKLTKFLSDRDN